MLQTETCFPHFVFQNLSLISVECLNLFTAALNVMLFAHIAKAILLRKAMVQGLEVILQVYTREYILSAFSDNIVGSSKSCIISW